jgi:hypothetical protein
MLGKAVFHTFSYGLKRISISSIIELPNRFGADGRQLEQAKRERKPAKA